MDKRMKKNMKNRTRPKGKDGRGGGGVGPGRALIFDAEPQLPTDPLFEDNPHDIPGEMDLLRQDLNAMSLLELDPLHTVRNRLNATLEDDPEDWICDDGNPHGITQTFVPTSN